MGPRASQSPEKVKKSRRCTQKWSIDFFANLQNRSNRGKITFWANGGNLEQSAKKSAGKKWRETKTSYFTQKLNQNGP